MAKAKLADIVAHCNRTLKTDSFEDWPGAVNGLQVENRGSVSRIAAAVDATPATVKKAADEGADLLIVHHGLFWGKTHPWTGNRYKIVSLDGEKTYQLFDLVEDPQEDHDLAQQHPEIVARMRKGLEAWRQSCRASTQGSDYGSPNISR